MSRKPPQTRHWRDPSTRWAYVQWRYSHRTQMQEQNRVTMALLGSWDPNVQAIGRRMHRCCDNFTASVDLRTAEVKHCPYHCDVMVCPTCLEHRHRTTLRKARFCVEQAIGRKQKLRHFVLTAPPWRGCPREGAERLARWFKRLTNRSAWRRRVKGAMAVFEATCKDDTWHWHIHLLTVGSFWAAQCRVSNPTGGMVPADPSARDETGCHCVDRVDRRTGRRNSPAHRCLMQEWYQVTKGAARIVHISSAGAEHRSYGMVDDDSDGWRRGDPVNEAVKYVVKTMELSNGQLATFVTAMRHFQRVRWVGEWQGMNPPEDLDHRPRVHVDPRDLWRRSTLTIGPLFTRLVGTEESPAIAEACGWQLHWFHGPQQMVGDQLAPRPPPLVEITKEFAELAVNDLHRVSADLSKLVDRHERKTGLPVQPSIHVPF